MAFDPVKHPRWPPGSGEKSGQFMTTGEIKKFADVAKRARISQKRNSPGKFHKFSGADADTWGENAFKDWRDGLSPEERNVLRGYGQEDYVNINASLRGNGSSEDVSGKIDALDAALGRAEVPDDVTVYRRFSDPQITSLHESGNLIGARIQDKGFTSTTADKDILSDLDLEHLQGGEVTAHIRVPAGTPGAYLGSLSSASEEQELLLSRGRTFVVRQAIEDFDGGLTITLDVVFEEFSEQQVAA